MTKTQFKPEHTFDTKALGYEYDVLHPTPKQNLRQMPYLALFKQVDIATLVRRATALPPAVALRGRV